jgi:NitT/TauT family transport system permease protein
MSEIAQASRRSAGSIFAEAWQSFLKSAPALKLSAGVLILLLWELIVRAFAPAYVAKPTGIIAVFPSVIGNPAFLSAAGSTLGAVAQGLALALIFGTVAGLAMGRIPAVERMLRYYVSSLYAIPMVAILPLVTLWFGYNADARLATVVFAAFFSIAINVTDGARAVPLEYLEVAKSFRAKPLHMLFDITLPAAIPYLLAGIRLAAGRALVGAVVAEFFIAINGLGYYILFNSRTFRHDRAFVAVIVLAAAGVGFEYVTNWLTRRFLPWHRRDEKTE